MAKIITLKKNEDRRITQGHLWAFSNEILNIEGSPQSGDVVELKNYAGNFLGIGFYNPHSLIAVRLLSEKREEIDTEFFRKRIESSYLLRRKVYPDEEAFRVIHGEADYLPGLIIDKYNNYYSVQAYSAGMDQRLPLICDVLESLFHPKGIVERNEAKMRTLDGLEQRSGILRGTVEPVTISEYGVQYNIDILHGQKTGFFLDQRENRKAFQRYVRDCTVLDCFCNDGGFALHAGVAGASNVTGIDSSDDTILRAQANAALNTISEKTTFLTSDAFDYLDSLNAKGKKYDVINLDPPSFAKSKKTVRTAKQGLKRLHLAAFKLLKEGGILATATCSHHVFEEVFLDIINDAARRQGRKINMLEWRGAPPDHPILPAMPETRYLKFGIFRVE